MLLFFNLLKIMIIYMEKASKKIYPLLLKVLSTVEIDTFLNLVNNIGNNSNRVLRRLNNFPYFRNQIIQCYEVGVLGYSKARQKDEMHPDWEGRNSAVCANVMRVYMRKSV